MRALVVTPTYQESENIVEFLNRAREAAPDADILVVDDNSPDGTADLADEVNARLGHIEVLRQQFCLVQSFGQGLYGRGLYELYVKCDRLGPDAAGRQAPDAPARRL